jgi:hypothetical protein
MEGEARAPRQEKRLKGSGGNQWKGQDQNPAFSPCCRLFLPTLLKARFFSKRVWPPRGSRASLTHPSHLLMNPVRNYGVEPFTDILRTSIKALRI